MLTAGKEEKLSRPMAWTDEGVLPLAASGVYPKTRVWGSNEKMLHYFSATAPLKIELRWGYEESSEKTAVGSGVTFKYDPLGRRIYKSSSAGTSIYAYDGDNLIEETNASGAAVARYSQNVNVMDEPFAMLRGGTTSYYDADGLSSITSLSNGTGSLVQTYGYDSFGKQTSSSGSLTNPFQYTAREFDTETSLYFYRSRYYDQTLGRFLSEDPIGFSNETYNLYNYVSGDPVDFNDPSGNKKIHGNWCGPNWTGGRVEPYIPAHDKPDENGKPYYKDPRDYVDKVCSFHDKCYATCRDKQPCSPLGRSLCSRKCDFFLVGRLVGNPKDIFSGPAYLIGAGIAANIVPLPGPNGDANSQDPAIMPKAGCCSGPPARGAGSH